MTSKEPPQQHRRNAGDMKNDCDVDVECSGKIDMKENTTKGSTQAAGGACAGADGACADASADGEDDPDDLVCLTRMKEFAFGRRSCGLVTGQSRFRPTVARSRHGVLSLSPLATLHGVVLRSLRGLVSSSEGKTDVGKQTGRKEGRKEDRLVGRQVGRHHMICLTL